MVPWKKQVCQMVCAKCGCKPVLVERTADACHVTDANQVQLAVAAIECDDISAMSSTPKSVVDETVSSARDLTSHVTSTLGHVTVCNSLWWWEVSAHLHSSPSL